MRIRPDETYDDGMNWAWDEGEWDWELAVRDMLEDVDCGYIAIVPLKDGDRFEHRVKPPPSHTEWKRRLDMLLGINTPEIPSEA